MDPVTLIVDSSTSKLSIRTRTTGMLARLAHDLELVASDIRGRVSREEGGFSGELSVSVAGIRVAGQLHGDRLDSSAISSSDRSEIERKIREEVFPGLKEILIRGRGREWNHVEATVDGGVRNLPVSFSIRGNEEAGQVRITGRTELSLAKLGVREIKGPLGAFKVKDAVEVLFEIILRPPG